MVWVLAKCVPMTIHRNDLDELKDLWGRKNWSLQVSPVLCPTQGDMRMRAEHRYSIPGDSVCLWCNRELDSHPHLFEVPLKSLSDVQKQTYHASTNRHFWNFSADGFILQDPLPLQYSKSRFPQLISLNGRESPQTEAQPACLPTKAGQSGLFTWAYISKSG